MHTLIIPVAGNSSRFPGLRPKWLLTMPDGKLMIEASIDTLDLLQFDRIIVVCLKEHVEKYINLESYSNALETTYGKSFEFIILDQPTKSQSGTVYEALKRADVTKSFFIKDCDNSFKYTFHGGNEVATLSF